jgi:hypothetical protein
MPDLERLTRAQLAALVRTSAKNWLAHDGLWFQAVEGTHGLDEAMRLDAEAWRRFSPIEARRIMDLLDMGPGGGLEALARALGWRMYALLNRQHSELSGGTLRFYMDECRVQEARRRKGLADFPCRDVGLVEYETFAVTVDPRIRTRCIACPPDDAPRDWVCGWEFTLAGGETTT